MLLAYDFVATFLYFEQIMRNLLAMLSVFDGCFPSADLLSSNLWKFKTAVKAGSTLTEKQQYGLLDRKSEASMDSFARLGSFGGNELMQKNVLTILWDV